MKRITYPLLALLAVGALSLGALGCNFYFSYASVEAPLGTVGEIGIRVEKTHNNCVLTSMDLYEIEGSGLQILGETEWTEISNGLYEKWVQVSLTSVGSGELKISKFCTKEGYQEAVLPVSVLTSTDDGLWTAAMAGTFPLELEIQAASVVGAPSVDDATLTIEGKSFDIPDGVALPETLPDDVRLYYGAVDGRDVLLLLVGDGLFLRFDHLIEAA